MSPEKQEAPGEKQNIRELLESKQNELDRVLEEISVEIEMWNLQFQEIAESSAKDRERKLSDLAQEAVVSLDTKWPFSGDSMHVSGRWYEPELVLDNSSLNFPMHEAEAFSIVRSNGFSVLEKEDRPPTVGLSFEFAELPLMSCAIQGNLSLLTYADPNEVSLYYTRPNLAPSHVTDLEMLGERLVYNDHLLMMHYHDSNSEFYRKSARHQKKFLYSVIDNVSDALPSPEFGEQAECSQVEAPYVYRRVGVGDGLEWQRVKSFDDQPILMSGKIHGVGILESTELDHDKPFRSKTELVDPNAGICLVIQVDQCSIPDIFNAQPVYIPLRIATDLQIAVP